MTNPFPALGKSVLGFAAHYKTYLIAGAAAVAVVGASYGAGFLKGEEHAAKQQVVSLKKDVQAAEDHGNQKATAILKADAKDQAQRTERVVRDLAREQQLQAQVDGLRATNDNMQRLLNAKPDPTPDCHVALGDVRMLNDASTPTGAGGDRASGASDPASVAAYQEQAPSSVTCRALVSEELAVRAQYGDLAARHDTLVDWVQKELIDPMKAQASSDKK